MADMQSNDSVWSFGRHRNKLMSLVESTKKRKKKQMWSIPASNIEHLVFKEIPTSPVTLSTEESSDWILKSNPVQLCRVHSRLIECQHEGRYNLRRSVSQPIELEITGSIQNLRDSTTGSIGNEKFSANKFSSIDKSPTKSDIFSGASLSSVSYPDWEIEDRTVYAEAIWDHETSDSEELFFETGDIIEVTDTSDEDWWWGIKGSQSGWFPSTFVKLYGNLENDESVQCENSFTTKSADSVNQLSNNNFTDEQVRANIVLEIIATERDYLQHLKDVVEGYLVQVQRRPDMFSKDRISSIFSNIQEIYEFERTFALLLENCLDQQNPHLSQLGNCFLKHKEDFKMYSEYCNNHPLAVNELQELYCDSQFIHFFEACRLLQEMIDISLDGFLLTPIQRICKYPLQLAELLKYTKDTHPDHSAVVEALQTMKETAELVNERKRRMECLEHLAEWQNSVEGWEGPDVLDSSSILLHSGEVTKVSSSSWSRDIYLFILDHQLIYCKKDLLKRQTFAYKGRINLDQCDIVDIEDGKDSHSGINVKNAWKIHCKVKEKWYLFCVKTSVEKKQFLDAFKRERERVCEDVKQAFMVTEEAKKSARTAVQNKLKPKRYRAKFPKGKHCHPDVAVTEVLLDPSTAKKRSGSLPSDMRHQLAFLAESKRCSARKKGTSWFQFGSGKTPKI